MKFPLVPGIAITVFIGCQALFVQAQEVDNIKHDQPSETSDVTELETPDIDNTSSKEVVEVVQDEEVLNSLSLNAPASITSSVGIEDDGNGLHLPSEIFQPHNIGNTGAFTYKIGFTVPSFRGLEPNIGLSYSSASLGLLKDQNIVATGWKLSGLSSIERVSEFGGVPWYEDDADVFKLDGMELLACNDAEATNP
ncbi:MAG: SpvB/TcaC N-terminal domain-containing protein, partial [Pseudoruegeria sp.]